MNKISNEEYSALVSSLGEETLGVLMEKEAADNFESEEFSEGQIELLAEIYGEAMMEKDAAEQQFYESSARIDAINMLLGNGPEDEEYEADDESYGYEDEGEE